MCISLLRFTHSLCCGDILASFRALDSECHLPVYFSPSLSRSLDFKAAVTLCDLSLLGLTNAINPIASAPSVKYICFSHNYF